MAEPMATSCPLADPISVMLSHPVLPLHTAAARYEAEVLGQWGDALTEDKLRSLARRADEIASSKPHPPSLPGPSLPGVANVADVPGVASTPLSDSLPVPAPVVSFNSPAMNGEEGKDDGPARLASGSSSVLNGSVHNGSVLGSSVGSNASGVSNGPVRKMSSGGLQVRRLHKPDGLCGHIRLSRLSLDF